MIFVCSGYSSTRALFPDLFGTDVSTVGQFLCQPNCNRAAKFLTWARMMRMNLAQSDDCQRPASPFGPLLTRA